MKKLIEDAVRSISDDDIVYEFHPEKFKEFCEKLCKEQIKVCRTSLKLIHLVSIKGKTEDPLIKAVDEPYISVENAMEDIGNSQIVEIEL